MFLSLYRFFGKRFSAGRRDRMTEKKLNKVWRYRPTLLQLEDRVVPTTVITVNTPSDIYIPPLSPPTTTVSLRSAIEQVNAGGDSSYDIQLPAGNYNIQLPGDDENADVTGDFDIAPTVGVTSVTIEQTGVGTVTINGMGLDRVFDIHPVAGEQLTVTFRNLTITGGATDGFGGGIKESGAGPGDVIVLDNAIVTQNQANLDGGGISAGAADVQLINGAAVTDNQAHGNAGGIGTTTGNVFIGKAGLVGAVSQATVDGNTAGQAGGGIYVGSSAMVFVEGGATAATASHVDGNSSSYSGGGIYQGGGSNLTILNSTVNNNLAGTSGSGGGVWTAAAEVSISGPAGTLPGTLVTQLDGNQAGANGGAIALTYQSSGGNSAIISNVDFTNNSAGGSGGAIYNNNMETLLVSGSQFVTNTAGINGGAIEDFGADLSGVDTETVSGSYFEGNIASLGNGGAIDAINPAVQETLTTDEFLFNTAGGNGGAVNVPGGSGSSVFQMTGSLVEGNISRTNGGGVEADTGNVLISSTTFQQNRANSGTGGGLDNVSSSASTTALLQILNSTSFLANQSGSTGGGVNTLASTAQLNSVILGTTGAGNRAGSAGGGLNFAGSTSLLVAGSTVQANTSTSTGGGVNVTTSSGAATVTGTNVDSNTAADNGAGINVSSANTLNVSQTSVSNNFSAATGGGIKTAAVTTNVTFTQFTNNRATTGGGGIAFDAAGVQTLNVANSTLAANQAGGGGSGGGILVAGGVGTATSISNLSQDDTTQIVDATVTDTTGLYIGESVVITGATPAGYNGTFAITAIPSGTDFEYVDPVQNFPNSGTGASYQVVSTANVVNTTLSENTAGQSGGGLANTAGNVSNLLYVTASLNTARFGGGLSNGVGSDPASNGISSYSGAGSVFLGNTVVGLNFAPPITTIGETAQTTGPDTGGTFTNMYENNLTSLSVGRGLGIPTTPLQIVAHNVVSVEDGGNIVDQQVLPPPSGNQTGTASSPGFNLANPGLGTLSANGGSAIHGPTLPGTPNALFMQTALAAVLPATFTASGAGYSDVFINSLAPTDERGTVARPITDIFGGNNPDAGAMQGS